MSTSFYLSIVFRHPHSPNPRDEDAWGSAPQTGLGQTDCSGCWGEFGQTSLAVWILDGLWSTGLFPDFDLYSERL